MTSHKLVVDAKDFNNQFGTIINETKENTYTVDFSMPDRDVVMTFTFDTKEMPEKRRDQGERDPKKRARPKRQARTGCVFTGSPPISSHPTTDSLMMMIS